MLPTPHHSSATWRLRASFAAGRSKAACKVQPKNVNLRSTCGTVMKVCETTTRARKGALEMCEMYNYELAWKSKIQPYPPPPHTQLEGNENNFRKPYEFFCFLIIIFWNPMNSSGCWPSSSETLNPHVEAQKPSQKTNLVSLIILKNYKNSPSSSENLWIPLVVEVSIFLRNRFGFWATSSR